MFGSRGIKIVIALSLGVMLICPAFSSEADMNTPQRANYVKYDFSDYMSAVRTKIQRNWTPPEVLEEGHAVVIFKIDKSGNVVSSYIKESSGNRVYDESALNSIQLASPYAQLPEESGKETITVLYSFDSSVVKADHIKELVQMSEMFINQDNQMALKYIDQAIREIEGAPAAYFLYARRHKIDKLLGNHQAAIDDLAECKRLKALYDKKRINKCKEALAQEETPFAYFTLANAYDLAGDYNNAIYNIDKAISMTELNHAYKRYRAEMVMRNSNK